MPSTILFDNGTHKNVLLPEFGEGAAVQANQHLIIDSGEGMILDPGGHKIYSKVLSETMQQLSGGKLKHIFLSHQDPDIVAAVNGWLMTTDATAWASGLWVRFIPHFGLDRLVVDRLKPLGDAGGFIPLGQTQMMVVPGHFLHSPGNFQVYDAISKILYSGDLGASIGPSYVEVTDFDAHVQYMEGFHRRYMASGRTMRAWAKMIRQLDIQVIAPQHGAFFKGPNVERFIAWCEGLTCGVDLADSLFQLPKA
jgi:flavorubredoxin